jgi:hypothetical protein
VIARPSAKQRIQAHGYFQGSHFSQARNGKASKNRKKNCIVSGFKDGRASRSGHGAEKVAQPRAEPSKANPLALPSVALVHGQLESQVGSNAGAGYAAPGKLQPT